MNNFSKYLVVCILLLSASLAYAIDDDSNLKKSAYFNEDKTNIFVTSDKKEFVIKLKSNKSTGYSWFLVNYDDDFIEPESYKYELSDTNVVGAQGFELFKFKVKTETFKVPQQRKIKFIYMRPWEGSDNKDKTVTFKIFNTL